MGQRFPFLAAFGAVGEASPMILSRLQEAIEALQPGADPMTAQVTFAELGKLLALALAPDTATEGDAEGPELREVVLGVEGRHVTLTSAEALAHPIAREWVTANLAGIFARIVERSADLSVLAHGAPGDWRCELFDVAGEYGAKVEIGIRPSVNMSVAAHYGPAASEAWVDTRRTINGALLWRLGSIIRDLTHPAEAGSVAEVRQAAVAACEAVAATMH